MDFTPRHGPDLYFKFGGNLQDHVMENDLILNKSVFERTFTKLSETELRVIYPALDTNKFKKKVSLSERITLPNGKLIVTSINRYERKKGISVGLKAIKLLKSQYGGQ